MDNVDIIVNQVVRYDNYHRRHFLSKCTFETETNQKTIQ